MSGVKIKGKLENITMKPSTIREVWIRPPSTRPGAEGLIVDEPVRVLVDDAGEFTVDLALGAGVLILIGPGGIGRESIPILVRENTVTMRQAVEDAEAFSPDMHDHLAELAKETADNLGEARRVQEQTIAAEKALADASRLLKESVAATVQKATAAVKDTAASLLDQAQAAQRAATQAQEGAEAAKKSASDSQSAAATLAGQASDARDQVTQQLQEWEARAKQLADWEERYAWLKENAAEGFSKVEDLLAIVKRSENRPALWIWDGQGAWKAPTEARAKDIVLDTKTGKLYYVKGA